MKNKIHYIYKITLLCGSLAGKYYLGKHTTSNPKDGYTGSGKIIVDYFKKYKKRKNKTYIKEILEYNPSMEANAEREKIIIGDLWKTDENCLNCCEGGETGGLSHVAWNKGIKGCFSEETIQKMSDAKKGKSSPFKGMRGRYTDETRAKIGAASKGRIPSAETRKKLSEAGMGRIVSEDTRKKISDAHKGKPMSETAKHNMMVAIMQYSMDGDYIQEWHGATEVENTIGLSHKQIWKCLKGYRKQVGGFIWKYKEAS